MTLIVGVRCSDGVVIGADGAATYGVLGQQTIRQPVKSKLQIRKGCLVVGVSGPVGLGQRFTEIVEDLWDKNKLSGAAPAAGMQVITDAFRPLIMAEMEVAKRARDVIGPAAITPALSATLVAVAIKKQPHLFQFDQQGSPEMATADLPFVAIGSGQTIADPFLALLRRLLWADREPSLAEATFAVVWTLHHAIQTNAGGVAEPMQVVWLEKSDCKAHQLPEENLEEHRQRVAEVESALAAAVVGDAKASPEAVPEPPPLQPAT